MVSFPTPQNYTFSTFGGIRLRNGVNTNGVISAEICQNIDFVPQGLLNNVKIVTSKGNTLRCEYENYKIIKGFETVQDGTKYCIVYATNGIEGKLLTLNSDDSFSTIVDGLHPIEKANGITMTDSAYDVFVFTNGQDYYKVCYDQSPIYEELTPEYNGSSVTGLALAEQDGSLVIGSDKGYVIASRKGDITDWDYVIKIPFNGAYTESEEFTIEQESSSERAEFWLIVKNDGAEKASTSNPSLTLRAASAFTLDMQKNTVAAVLAYPITNGKAGKPYGAVYPYNTRLSKKEGFSAYIADRLYRGADNKDAATQDYVSRFNWPRFIEICSSFENPWDIDEERILNALSAGKFSKSDIKLSKKKAETK